MLFIAPKTASVHVSNILGKLGAASRTEAAAIAHREGLVSQPSGRDTDALAHSGESAARISPARCAAASGATEGLPICGSQFRS